VKKKFITKKIASIDEATVVKRNYLAHEKDSYVMIDHPGTAIVAAKHNHCLLMLLQYRKTIDKVTMEFPGGVIKKGESPLDAVKREFKEETHLELNSPQQLGSYIASVGTSNEKFHLFADKLSSISKDIKIIDSKFEITHNEQIYQLVFVPGELFIPLINKAIIYDSKSIMAYFLSSLPGKT